MKGRLDSLLAAGVERGAVPGATFCVVDANGVLYNGGAGVRSLGSSEAMTPDTVGQIYSMTKALTGAAAMQMVEEGVMELDAPAAEVCPELADVGVLDGFDVDGAPRFRPPIRPITLRNLLTHTSGFVYDLWNDDLVRWRRSSQVPDLRSGLRSSLKPLGVRHRYRLGGSNDRSDDWPSAGRGLSTAVDRPAWDDRYGVLVVAFHDGEACVDSSSTAGPVDDCSTARRSFGWRIPVGGQRSIRNGS